MMAVTIKDVAREAHVSVASVSRALNGHHNVTDETRQRAFVFSGRNPTDQALIDAEREHVERLFCAIFFGACPRCHWPVVSFADGFKLDWPARSPHRCKGPEPLPARIDAGGAPSRQQPSQRAGRPARTVEL